MVSYMLMSEHMEHLINLYAFCYKKFYLVVLLSTGDYDPCEG